MSYCLGIAEIVINIEIWKKKGKVGKYSKLLLSFLKKNQKYLKKKSSISDNFCKEKKSDLKKVYLWLTPLEYLIEGIFGEWFNFSINHFNY